VTAAVRPVETRLVVRDPRDGSVRPRELEALAREAGVHPDLVRRLLALGLLDPSPGGRATRTAFPRDAAPRLARAMRLRRDLGLNYAGALLAGELLDRIDLLEQRLRRYELADPKRR
jgi:hypothetical protein